MASSHAIGNEVSGDGASVTQILANDVLLGRGAGPNEHKGNIAFRATVAKFKKSYMATTNRKIKNSIARKAIQAIKANKGRFLQRTKESEEVYELADDAVVLEKTKQALRHIDRTKRRTTSFHQPSSSSFDIVGFNQANLVNEDKRFGGINFHTEAMLQQFISRLQDTTQISTPPRGMISNFLPHCSSSVSEVQISPLFRVSTEIARIENNASNLSSLLALGWSTELQPIIQEEMLKLLAKSMIQNSSQSDKPQVFPASNNVYFQCSHRSIN